MRASIARWRWWWRGLRATDKKREKGQRSGWKNGLRHRRRPTVNERGGHADSRRMKEWRDEAEEAEAGKEEVEGPPTPPPTAAHVALMPVSPMRRPSTDVLDLTTHFRQQLGDTQRQLNCTRSATRILIAGPCNWPQSKYFHPFPRNWWSVSMFVSHAWIRSLRYSNEPNKRPTRSTDFSTRQIVKRGNWHGKNDSRQNTLDIAEIVTTTIFRPEKVRLERKKEEGHITETGVPS